MNQSEYPNLLSDCSKASLLMKTNKLNTINRMKQITLLGFSVCEAKAIVNGYLEDERIRQRKNKAKLRS